MLKESQKDLAQVSFLDHIQEKITEQIQLLQGGIESQQLTMMRLFEDAQKMRNEQEVMTQLKLDSEDSQDKVLSFLAERREEEQLAQMKKLPQEQLLKDGSFGGGLSFWASCC